MAEGTPTGVGPGALGAPEKPPKGPPEGDEDEEALGEEEAATAAAPATPETSAPPKPPEDEEPPSIGREDETYGSPENGQQPTSDEGFALPQPVGP